MIVMKFGGTSVADRAAIERLIGIVRAARQAAIQPESADWRGPVVVVSALGGATDRLLGVAAEAAAGDFEGAQEHVHALRDRHLQVAGVIVGATERDEVEQFIRKEFAELERIGGALSVLREVTPRWLDAIAAAGEIVSSRIVSAALTSHGLAASWVDARDVMVTSKEHTAAAPLFAETDAALARRIDPLLASRRIPVIGGFVGATPDGVTTTLGRGGSDYSAAIIGAGLGATEIQIWTDVDGMLTADPRVVRDVRVVPHLSFAEASELAYFGAKVLHPATIQPAVAKNIPVRILNSMRPQDAMGTLITRDRPAGSGPLTAVASKKNVTVVDITSTRMLMAHGFLKRIFEVFEQHRTSVDVVTTSEVSVSVTLDDARRVPEIMAALADVADVTCEDRMAIICAVGEGLQTDPTFVSHLLEAVGGIPIRMVSQAAARRNVTLVINEADLEPALARVHARFFADEAEAIERQAALPVESVKRSIDRLID
jgi:aspartate kinase